MSRSFRGHPDPGEDSASAQNSGQTTPPPQGAPQPGGFKFSSMHKYGADEKLAVEPERVDTGKRMVAGLIDVMVGYVLQLVVNCIPFLNILIHDQLPLVAFLIVRDALFKGRGVGKNLMGLQVVDIKTGLPASFMQSTKRNMVVFGPYVALYLANLVFRMVPIEVVNSLPKEMVSREMAAFFLTTYPAIASVVTNIVTGAGTVYTLAVIPYEAWRVYSRADGLRWGDKFAGTAIISADMDFSNPLSK